MAQQAPGRRAASVAFALAVALSLVVLFKPSADGPLPFPQADKLVHAGLFAVLAATARWRFGPVPAVLAAVAAYAPLSEVVQAVALPHRDGDWRDATADLAGVVLGWLLAAAVLLRSRVSAGR